MALIISYLIEQKILQKHKVHKHEVEECFANRNGDFLIDDREEHRTTPETHWFIAETDYARKLRVYFVPCIVDDVMSMCLKTALEPKQHHIDLYKDKAY